MNTIHGMPMGDSPERARANMALFRLAAAALAHPVPELYEAFTDGRFHASFNQAWQAITGRPWPQCPPGPSFIALEAGYIDMFMHGQRGSPRVHLLAGDVDALRDGVTRPVYMLNLQAFYKHFDLQANTHDEGNHEEPDHVATMLEFMAVLHHLEAQALERGADPSAYRRAQRDFLQRYLIPLTDTIRREVARQSSKDLDANLVRIIDDLPDRLHQQLAELELRVGPGTDVATPDTARPRKLAQNLWS